ncbi:hypothetical protein ACH5BK_06015 [Arcobacter sp. YIC-80]|uniref:hypothetical protein n=1 Tax=Arcobacter sp. YIC-80 TaxID=3376683 RepID=UPI00384FF3DD
MGNNQSGFDNEDKIIDALHNKTFNQINTNLQELIKYCFTNYNGTILCEKQAGQNKSDLKITIGSESYTYSIKKGTGNSVHQEPVSKFIDFLKENYSITAQLENDIKFFIWGDDTFDGTGEVKNRLSAPKFKKQHPDIIKRINDFFTPLKKDLIKRFVIDGADCSTFSSDYIYYGNEMEGVCCKSEKALDWLSENNSNGAIPIGRLSFQAWNRNINGGDKSEHKRGVIQLKWGSIKEDIKKARDE